MEAIREYLPYSGKTRRPLVENSLVLISCFPTSRRASTSRHQTTTFARRMSQPAMTQTSLSRLVAPSRWATRTGSLTGRPGWSRASRLWACRSRRASPVASCWVTIIPRPRSVLRTRLEVLLMSTFTRRDAIKRTRSSGFSLRLLLRRSCSPERRQQVRNHVLGDGNIYIF